MDNVGGMYGGWCMHIHGVCVRRTTKLCWRMRRSVKNENDDREIATWVLALVLFCAHLVLYFFMNFWPRDFENFAVVLLDWLARPSTFLHQRNRMSTETPCGERVEHMMHIFKYTSLNKIDYLFFFGG